MRREVPGRMLALVLTTLVAASDAPPLDLGTGVFVEQRGEGPMSTGQLLHLRGGLPSGLTLGFTGGAGAHLHGPTFLAGASLGVRFEPGDFTVRPYVGGAWSYTLSRSWEDGSVSRLMQARAVSGVELMSESRIFGLGFEAGAMRTLRIANDPVRWTPVVTTTLTWYLR